ncbi:ABC transporter substrate-binding protein [Paenibacillus sp. HB172176]|uniref:ABC transporter substrate-binding protein n=1 Tax=Paenibacillus sp. HB172176 TaxID=2493690 RepID=UPI00143B772A|nr:ABC transporter substrate-binding protein [Paenibacillus sp. HB172176]
MKTWKSIGILSVILLLVTTALGACSTNNKENDEEGELETTKLTLVGVRDAQISSQQIIADKLGYFKDEGLEVTNQLIESGPDMLGMIAGGSAPVSFQTNFGDFIMASNGVKVKIVAPLAQIAGTQAVVAGKNTVVNSPKDFEGKTIGIPSGADVMIAIDNMAKEYGVDKDKIKLVNIAPSDAVTALDKGQIDFMACWEPWITKGIAMGGKFMFSGTKSEIPGAEGDVSWMSVHTTIQVTDDYLSENPNTIKAVLRALEKATDYINEHREDAVKLLAPELHLEEAELTEIMNRNAYSMEVDDAFVNQSNGQAVFDYEMKQGNIKSIPPYSDYIDLSLFKEISPDKIKAEFK